MKLPRLYPLQATIAAEKTRHRLVVAGRRSGKTRLCSVLATNELLNGRRAWWVAPVSSQSAIGWRMVTNLVKNVPGVTISLSERALYFKEGWLFFKTAESRDNLRGEGLDFLVGDEFAFIDERVWGDCLRPALSDRLGRAVLVSTPNKENDLFHRLYKRGQENDPQWKSWKFPSAANPYLSRREIEDARADLLPLVYRREYEAEFIGSVGALVSREQLTFGRCPDVGTLDLAIGVDPAISLKSTADFTAVVVLGRDRNTGVFYVLDALVARLAFNEQLQAITELATRWEAPVFCEAVAYQSALAQELLRTTTFTVNPVRPSKDKLTRAAPWYNRVQQNLVVWDPDLPGELIDQVTSFPVAKHDDGVDAVSYAYDGLSNPQPSLEIV